MPTDQTILIGEVTVTRVIEWAGPIKTVGEILPDTPAKDWQANRTLLAPEFWDPGTDGYLCHIQTWVIRTVLVDNRRGVRAHVPQRHLLGPARRLRLLPPG